MKRAVVLGGGGSRGSYQVGVWKALRELGYEYDIVCGTSVGSLNAALMAQGEYDKALELWGRITTEDVLEMEGEADVTTSPGRRKLLREFVDKFVKEGGVDPAPLERMLRQAVDEEKIRRSPVDFGLVTVEFPTMKPLVLTKDNIPQGELCDYLMASSACYPAMKSRHIAGKQYIDGGYYSNLPVEIALEQGADEIVAVDLDAIGVMRPVKNPGKQVVTIRCKWDLGVFLVFDPQTAARNIDLGYNDAMKAFGKLEGDWYCFFSGEIAPNCDGIVNRLGPLTGRMYYDAGMDRSRWVRGMAQEALTRILGGRPGQADVQSVLAWAEAAGRLLELDPVPVYSFDRFNNEIEKAAALLPELPADMGEALAALTSGRSMEEWLQSLDKKTLLAYLRSLLRESQGERWISQADLLSLFAALAPDELMAALYLYALEQNMQEDEI